MSESLFSVPFRAEKREAMGEGVCAVGVAGQVVATESDRREKGRIGKKRDALSAVNGLNKRKRKPKRGK